jgi:hypothetical protein
LEAGDCSRTVICIAGGAGEGNALTEDENSSEESHGEKSTGRLILESLEMEIEMEMEMRMQNNVDLFI